MTANVERLAIDLRAFGAWLMAAFARHLRTLRARTPAHGIDWMDIWARRLNLADLENTPAIRDPLTHAPARLSDPRLAGSRSGLPTP